MNRRAIEKLKFIARKHVERRKARTAQQMGKQNPPLQDVASKQAAAPEVLSYADQDTNKKLQVLGTAVNPKASPLPPPDPSPSAPFGAQGDKRRYGGLGHDLDRPHEGGYGVT